MFPMPKSPVKFLPLGAIIQEFWIGSRNIVLGFKTQDEYQSRQHPYFGETIGRIPNRLSDGRITGLNGRDYVFVRNERNATTLHGGVVGWGKQIWDGPHTVKRRSRDAVLFTLRSPDGDEGFPGQVDARVWYTVEERGQEEEGQGDTGTRTTRRGAEEVVLDVEYEIEMTGDEADVSETVCSMTNHGYWNLGDGPTVAGMEVEFDTDLHLEVDDLQIPTGRILPYPAVTRGQPVSFTSAWPVIDDCFVLETDPRTVPLDTRDLPLRRYVTMSHAGTGIRLEGFTTEPTFQFYSGDGIRVGDAGAGGSSALPRAGIALEPNRYVNAVNMPEWRSMVHLKRGQTWGCRNRFHVSYNGDGAGDDVAKE